MKMPKNNIDLYRICLNVNNDILFLKNVTKCIFTDEPGYFWTKLEKAEFYLSDIRVYFKDAYISTITRDEYTQAESSHVKKNVKVAADIGDVEKSTHTHTTNKVEPEVVVDDEKDDNLVEEEIDEMLLFKRLNVQCMKCTKSCKQSSYAIIERCSAYSIQK